MLSDSSNVDVQSPFLALGDNFFSFGVSERDKVRVILIITFVAERHIAAKGEGTTPHDLNHCGTNLVDDGFGV